MPRGPFDPYQAQYHNPYTARARIHGPFEMETRPSYGTRGSYHDEYIIRDRGTGEPLAITGEHGVAVRIIELLNWGMEFERYGNRINREPKVVTVTKPHPDSLEAFLFLLRGKL